LFHKDRYKVKYRLISAGTGGGKTIAGVFEILSWLIENNGSVGYIFEPSYPMVRRILIPTLETLLGFPIEKNALVSTFNKSDKLIDLTNGSRLWFGSLEHPEMAEGPNIDVVHLDEGRLVREFDLAWKTILRRIRGSVPGKYPTGAFITTTPNAPGSDLYKFFEDPLGKDPQARVYRWSIFDNPHLTKEYVDSIVRSHTKGLADRFIYGQFAQAGGKTFRFDSTVHVREITRDLLTEIRYGVDFGWTNPACILAVGLDHDGRMWVLDEAYGSQLPTEKLIEALQDFYSRYGHGKIICDPSDPETIEMIRRANLKVEGNKYKREDGIRELGGRFAVQGDGKPRIFISAKCVNLISELAEYDENVKENDHAVDALRYAMKLKVSHPQGLVSFGVVGDK
jgi:phage terminase large subunit-like protein